MENVSVMRNQSGSGLIEVLVAMVILSLGVLGAASYISNSMRNSHSSYVRSHATWLAVDIIDRMRANRAAAESAPFLYNIGFLNPPPNGATVVDRDLQEWRAAIATSLPAGTGSVNFDNVTQNVTVKIRWNDSRVLRATDDATDDANVTRTFTLETRL
jgi:type IV pilus assembly protein PilV